MAPPPLSLLDVPVYLQFVNEHAVRVREAAAKELKAMAAPLEVLERSANTAFVNEAV